MYVNPVAIFIHHLIWNIFCHFFKEIKKPGKRYIFRYIITNNILKPLSISALYKYLIFPTIPNFFKIFRFKCKHLVY